MIELTRADCVLVKRQVRKIGVMKLWFKPETNEWFVSLDNRTYHNVIRIEEDRLPHWRQEFGLP